MSALRWVIVAGALLGSASRAQAPEDEWGAFPGTPSSTQPATPTPPPAATPEAAPVEAVAPPASARLGYRQRPVEPPNTVSMMGASALGQWKRGQLFLLGFPLLSVRAAIGLTDWFDIGLGFDSFYGQMNEPLLTLRFALLQSEVWSLAVTLDGGYAFFGQTAARETRGSRWITGRRNGNVSPAFVASFRAKGSRAARIFFELRYLLSFDTEPVSSAPLSGVPPALVLGHNGSVHGGAELPLSTTTSFVFQLGLDFHGRVEDAPAIPIFSVGLVTGI